MNNILYIFIIIFPIIDVFTSFNIRYNLMPISPSITIRGIFLLYCFIYTIIKKNKKILIYYLILLVFFIVFISLKINTNISNYLLVNEIKIFIKFWYFPISLIFLNIFKIDNKKLNKSIKLSIILYILFILLPLLTNTAFNSYDKYFKGIVGWYYSANELGTILSSNLILLYLMLNKNDKLIPILIILNIFTLSLIGTKVSLLSIIIITSSTFLIYLIKDKKNIKIPLIILIISIILISINSNSYDILKRITPDITPVFKDNDEIINTSFINKILSGRDVYLLNTYYKYKSTNIMNKLFGLGFTYNNKISVTEMDLFDILFGYGIIGLLIYFIPLIYYIIKNIHIKLNINNLICILGFILIFTISILSGHTLSAPAVSIYLSLIINSINKKNKHE